MTQSRAETVGVDISKDHLDVYLYPSAAAKRFVNDLRGHRSLIAWLTSYQVERVVFEATGADHRGFERTLASAGLPMAKINPRQARRFAALGSRAAGQPAHTGRLEVYAASAQTGLHGRRYFGSSIDHVAQATLDEPAAAS